jgi:protein-S-isoprenylcysteine O-methyltransferase Ste14
MLAYVPFAGGVLCATVLLVGFAATAFTDSYRFWPPGTDEGKRSVYLFCSNGFLLCTLSTTVLDAGSVTIPLWSRVVGGVVVVFAVGLLMRSAFELGEEETEGRVGELRTDGLYRYTRNPQNLGGILFFWSLAVVSASLLVAILASAVTIWMVVQSRIEEPWLQEKYDGYAEYARTVPRFIGIRSLRRVVETIRSARTDTDS